MQGTEDQCKGQKNSAWDGRSVLGTGGRCLGQKISARDKRSTLRTLHGVIHELLISILHAQTRCRSVHERVDLPLVKRLWKIRTEPPGRRAAGPWKAAGCGPLGLRAAGPPGRGGFWAAGLLLAKPFGLAPKMGRSRLATRCSMTVAR